MEEKDDEKAKETNILEEKVNETMNESELFHHVF